MNTDCATVTTVVALDPDTAFAVFTDEFSAWWKPKGVRHLSSRPQRHPEV